MLTDKLLQKLVQEKVCVRCYTLEDGYEFINELKSLGWKWLNNADLNTTFYWENNYEKYGANSAFRLFDNNKICLSTNLSNVVSYASLKDREVIDFVEDVTKGVEWGDGYQVGKLIENVFESAQQGELEELEINKAVLVKVIKNFKERGRL